MYPIYVGRETSPQALIQNITFVTMGARFFEIEISLVRICFGLL